MVTGVFVGGGRGEGGASEEKRIGGNVENVSVRGRSVTGGKTEGRLKI